MKKQELKLTNTILHKLKFAAKYKTGTILKITKKNFQDEELPHELILKIKIRNVFANNMLTDIKLSKAQLFKIIHSDGLLCSMSNLGKKRL